MAQTAHRSTSRVLDIFELLSTTSSDGATLTEIAQALESPKSSILPILQTLVARGYIDMDYRTNKYSIHHHTQFPYFWRFPFQDAQEPQTTFSHCLACQCVPPCRDRNPRHNWGRKSQGCHRDRSPFHPVYKRNSAIRRTTHSAAFLSSSKFNHNLLSRRQMLFYQRKSIGNARKRNNV